MSPPLSLALYQPDIPQNTGTLLRLSACLGVGLEIIEPCGFLFDDRRMRRAGMDYVAQARYRRHADWAAFDRARRDAGQRLILLTTAGELGLKGFAFRPGDILMVGRESAGVPAAVAAACDVRLRIPMRAEARSLNVALAATLAVGAALEQLTENGFL